MRLETSQDLLERVRARHSCSWYALAGLLGTHKNTVYNWKGGHTIVDRKFATRIAELLGEPAEYVLACIECEREQDVSARKLWRSIAEKFRAHAASVLLAALAITVAGKPEISAAAAPSSASERGSMYLMFNRRRGARRLSGTGSTRNHNKNPGSPWNRMLPFTAILRRAWRASPAAI
jgi:transcriptional regulator with XRE-family HTH domain